MLSMHLTNQESQYFNLWLYMKEKRGEIEEFQKYTK